MVLAALCASLLGCATGQQGSERPGGSSAREPSSFEEAQLLARRDESNPATLEWRRKSTAALGPALSVTDPCREGIAFADIPTVNVVVRLSFQGRATQVYALETSTYAKCFRDRMQLLDLGSAPWEGYWFEVRMAGSAESAQRQSQVVSFAGEACVPGTEIAGSAPSLTILKATPSSGSTIAQSTRVSIVLSYSLPKESAERYRLMAIFDAATPGRAVSTGPIDFPFPVTCGSSGSVMASLQVSYFWNMPMLPNPIKVRLAIVDAVDFRVIAQAEAMEYSKP